MEMQPLFLLLGVGGISYSWPFALHGDYRKPLI